MYGRSGETFTAKGGLYLEGSNQQPTPHKDAGEAIAAGIVPIDGEIGLLSLGPCNAFLEWGGGDGSVTGFMPRANNELAKSSSVVIVNGAKAGQEAKDWAVLPENFTDCRSIVADPWKNAVDKVEARGLTCDQVQVVWMEHAVIDPGCPPYVTDFYSSAESLHQLLVTITQNVYRVFPNCKIAFLSTRTESYVTMATQNCTNRTYTHNPEPFAYETGFANKWTIADQINYPCGVLAFYNPLPHQDQCPWVKAPYIAWGPYFWINGPIPRSDLKTWNSWDLKPTNAQGAGDWVHPTTCGIGKVADQLLAFFETNPLAAPWFLNTNTGSMTAVPDYRSCPNQGANTFQFCAAVQNASSNLRFMWDFDDGDYEFNNPRPIKRYPAPGVYNVHLTVVDLNTLNGTHASGSVTVTVP